MSSTAYNLRRADVIARRAVRQALRAWWTVNVRAAMALTRLSASLPASRKAQDAALYGCGFVGCLVIGHMA